MELSPSLLASFAVLAGLAGLGSYYIYQWAASYGWRSTLPWFVSALAVALILLGLLLVIFQSLPNFSIARLSAAPSIGSPDRRNDSPSRFGPRESEAVPPESDFAVASRLRQAGFDRRKGVQSSALVQSAEPSAAEQVKGRSIADSSSTQASRAEAVVREVWLEDQSFWGATRCVLALRLDPEDLATWVLINDCGVDVRILVATCAKAFQECFQRGSDSWWYAPEGVFLPAKYKRSVALEKQTVRGQYLRYVACRVNVPSDSQPLDRRAGELRQVGVQSCDEEVKSLAQLGLQTRSRVEEVVNEPVPANPCCRLE